MPALIYGDYIQRAMMAGGYAAEGATADLDEMPRLSVDVGGVIRDVRSSNVRRMRTRPWPCVIYSYYVRVDDRTAGRRRLGRFGWPTVCFFLAASGNGKLRARGGGQTGRERGTEGGP